ncbi:hypothetical protein PJ267_05750 [Arthrobacter sp. OVS8]|nr:hypothetical protein PJ267_05750 [Arthrobacter sp. OVS8]
MAAAGRETANRGAEEFGVFDDAAPGALAPVPLPPLDGFPPRKPRTGEQGGEAPL